MNSAPSDYLSSAPLQPEQLGQPVVCPTCQLNTAHESRCDQCGQPITVRSFPRATHELPVNPKSNPATDTEATCQFFSELRAEVVCDECGCFMSHQATVELQGKQFCMPCVHSQRELNANAAFRADLRIWDNLALFLIALLPLSLFTAPVSLFLLIRYRNAPPGFVTRNKSRWWLAMIASIASLIVWLAVFVFWLSLVIQEFRN